MTVTVTGDNANGRNVRKTSMPSWARPLDSDMAAIVGTVELCARRASLLARLGPGRSVGWRSDEALRASAGEVEGHELGWRRRWLALGEAERLREQLEQVSWWENGRCLEMTGRCSLRVRVPGCAPMRLGVVLQLPRGWAVSHWSAARPSSTADH